MCASGAKDKNGNKGQDTVAVNEANFKGSSEASSKRFTQPRRFSSDARSGIARARGRGTHALPQRRYAAAAPEPNVLAVAFEIVASEQNEGLTRDHLTL